MGTTHRTGLFALITVRQRQTIEAELWYSAEENTVRLESRHSELMGERVHMPPPQNAMYVCVLCGSFPLAETVHPGGMLLKTRDIREAP